MKETNDVIGVVAAADAEAADAEVREKPVGAPRILSRETMTSSSAETLNLIGRSDIAWTLAWRKRGKIGDEEDGSAMGLRVVRSERQEDKIGEA